MNKHLKHVLPRHRCKPKLVKCLQSGTIPFVDDSCSLPSREIEINENIQFKREIRNPLITEKWSKNLQIEKSNAVCKRGQIKNKSAVSIPQIVVEASSENAKDEETLLLVKENQLITIEDAVNSIKIEFDKLAENEEIGNESQKAKLHGLPDEDLNFLKVAAKEVIKQRRSDSSTTISSEGILK